MTTAPYFITFFACLILPELISFVYGYRAGFAAEKYGVDAFWLIWSISEQTPKGRAAISDLRKRDSKFNEMYLKMVRWHVITFAVGLPLMVAIMVALSHFGY